VHDLVVGGGDVFAGDDLHLRHHAVGRAEVQHLLGFGDAADLGARQHLVAIGQARQPQRARVLGQTDIDEHAAGLQQLQHRVQVGHRRHRRDHQVETAAQFPQPLGFTGRVIVAGTEAQAVVLLAHGLADHHDLGTHLRRDLDANMSKAAHADDGDLLTRSGTPPLER